MPEILNATNPVPGYDNTVINRNIPLSPDSTQIQNVPDPSRVGRADGKTEQQDNGSLGSFENIRYDSNFQTFLQRLREAPSLAESLSALFSGREGTVVLSGMSEGLAAEMAQVMEMLHMDEGELLSFMTGQFKAGTRFGGVLFALLRNAYARASSDSVRQDILLFLKTYADYSSTEHIEGNILRNLRGMADAMPASWAEKLRELTAQMENAIAAGDRQSGLALLQQEVFPHMSAYVGRTHDLGVSRGLLSLLTLDMARYENGSQENLLQAFRRLVSYGTLKDQLGGFSDQELLTLLRSSEFNKASAANQFAQHLSNAAAHALSGEGDAATQQVFQQLVAAMLINESVYMPVNHYLIPLEWDGKFLFSEMWVDPDAEDKNGGQADKRQGHTVKILFKMDVQALGLFDVIISSTGREVDIHISCPERVVPFSRQIEQSLAQILTQNGLTPAAVSVRKMERPVTLTEVFPQIFERKNSVNVKV